MSESQDFDHESLQAERSRLARESTASRVADALRARIIDGDLPPGAKLSQERVQEALGVSRSTLREALQLLIRERLLVHELSRGVFVRQLTMQDISDLYRVRRIVECAALRSVEVMRPEGLRRLVAAIEDGHDAADAGEWGRVAAASIRFHEALVALAGSQRLDSLVTEILAEFRLAYAFMHDTQTFHTEFLRRHTIIAEAVRSGDLGGAADLLHVYLLDAERAVLRSYQPAPTHRRD
ncbi:MAG TPA: GntR family transcriptional regulator [Nocardioidaceae bacterium]|nr:GntR family transcriptional regulator [Nocardioidaceae bacterium]